MAKRSIHARQTQAELTLPAEVTQGLRIGSLAGWDAGPLVDFPGNERGPLRARSLVSLDEPRVRRAQAQQREVLLAFDGAQPIVLGLLDDAPELRRFDAIVDGKRVELRAEEEIVLTCGDASITLRANGRVVIRGAYVETRAAGVNRIKGGTVLIN
jgi:hypothetical protein